MTLEIPRITPGVAAGITEDLIHQVVHAFYTEVRRDPALAPVFDRAIGDGWDIHLARMCDFWSSVMLLTGRFKGAPMRVHAAIPGLGPAHFARWLQLFRQTVERVCPGEPAALFLRKAETIGQSLQLGLATLRGIPVAGGAA